jgi:mRNA interferase MazF
MVTPLVKTGEIWLVQLDPTVGREIQKTRPCVVISPQEMNEYLQTVIVAPMTTGSRPAGFRVPVGFQGKQGLIVLDQIRTLDRLRLVKRLGVLRAPTLAATLQTLQAMFAPAASGLSSLSGAPAK